MQEVISIHIGQAGVQMASAIWEQFCAEHDLDSTGKLKENCEADSRGFSTFFCASDSQQFVPRAILIDLEPSVVDEIRAGPYRRLFHPNMLITSNEDAASNFARGHFTAGRLIIENVINQVRKVIQTCDKLAGFILTSSFGGGTGSGFQTLVAEKLAIEYAKYLKVAFVVYPSSSLATSTVESYNAMLNNHFTIDKSDLSVLFDNSSLYRVCQTFLNIDSPTYSNLNRILAHITSCVTVSLRYDSSLNSDLDQIVTNIVPFPRIHFPILNAAPIISESRASHKTISVMEITKMIFDHENAMVSVDTLDGDYFCCSLQYRGNATPRDINEAIYSMKKKHLINFVDWCPTGFKIGLSFHPPMSIAASGIAQTSIGMSMLANTSAIEQVFTSLCKNFDILFQKRSFVHWFVGEGMEEGEFTETRDSMTYLIADYKGMQTHSKSTENKQPVFNENYAAPNVIKQKSIDIPMKNQDKHEDILKEPMLLSDRPSSTNNNEPPLIIIKEDEELLFKTSDDNNLKHNEEIIDDLTLLYD